MLNKKFILVLFIIVQFPLFSQKIALEDIWVNYKYYPAQHAGFNSMNDGISYTDQEENGDINQYELSSGKKIKNILDGKLLKYKGKPVTVESYSFSDDESKIVLETESEGIYRRSSVANYFIYDVQSASLKPLSEKGKQMFATVAPAGNKCAFVRNNNIFICDLNTGNEVQVTTDGEINKIKNGWSDWVYEEEFSIARAFFWSPDGKRIAYLRFDESQVKEFEMAMYGDLYPEQYKFKYPKAGEANSVVSVHIYDLSNNKTQKCDIGTETDIYIPRINWTQDPSTLCITRLNRLQNKVELLLSDANGKTNLLLKEESKTYLEINDDLTFLKNNKGFIWSSEKDGYNHLYYYDMKGQLINQITSGKWDVISFIGLNESKNLVYYVSTETSATDRDVYAIDINGKAKKKISNRKGTTSVSFSKSYKYYVSTWSDANTPPLVELYSEDRKLIKVLENNSALVETAKKDGFTKKEFFTFTTSENVLLNGWMMKPTNFDPKKKYPVFMFAYGGPGSNEVNNQWELFDLPWHSFLNQQGYLVVCVDGRGTLGRGKEFKHSTYLQLGKLETMDQIEVAKYLGKQEYVDKNRIGFMGWSFGGYLSSLLATKASDTFKTCIAVAPVTNWKYYDNIYTERFLRTPKENRLGYEENSPINFVQNLKCKYLLVHGTADDNVHFQNSVEMTNSLINANIPFDLMIYPNKNHGIMGGNSRIHLFNKMFMFVKDNL